ncbi:ankyrin repeat domain-containing protein [Rickettsiales endosymbiont of Stachyamoeba lipophora]|uniref:ankyrin repeat domain-containing protein n=1 Tax=Rickettsiales endosymbiont of Stachyamoeba lipophora TaxID=2486578 RepID=UPI000F654180|nr:ankyrin repeat domain-containing protein [Rickettsiales endosymbiont of Stachyamoeba lipophora]AZL15710.1 ankyrin repeat domain-containing protein [Rickettsiales endosymbiont of Stachyamoeba lipophora]
MIARLVIILSFLYASSVYASNDPAIITAIKTNNNSQLVNLIQQGQLVDTQGELGETPLMQAITFRNNEAAKTLIRFGANINAQDAAGVTPLHLAARTGNIEIANFLIKAGANINAKDKFGMTPIMKAVASNKNKLVELLISHNADLSNKDMYGYDALKLAQKTHNNKATKHINYRINNNLAGQAIELNNIQQVVKVKEVKSTADQGSSTEQSLITPSPITIKKDLKITVTEPIKPQKTLVIANRKFDPSKNVATQDLAWLATPPKLTNSAIKVNQLKHTHPVKLVKDTKNTKIKSSSQITKTKATTSASNHYKKTAKVIKTKHSKIKIVKAQLVDGKKATEISKAYTAATKAKYSYWLLAKPATQSQPASNYPQELTNSAIDVLRNYKVKYQVIKNLKNDQKYVKIGAFADVFEAEYNCQHLTMSNKFDKCIVKKAK